MQTVRGEKRCVADLEVGDIFLHAWDNRWVRVTQTYKHPQSPYNKIHVDALDGSYKNLYVKLYLTMSVTAKPRISMQQKEADTRGVAVNTAAQLIEKFRQELLDYAALNNHTSETVQILGVNFEVETLRRELSMRIQVTQLQLADSVKKL